MPLFFPDTNVNILELKSILTEALSEYPVMHLRPWDVRDQDYNKFIVTRLMSGRYSLKPNISSQGLLFHGNSSVAKSKYSSLTEITRGLDDHSEKQIQWISENVRRADFELLIKSFPLYKMLSEGVNIDDEILRVEIPYGLAHSYGFVSPFISFSSDLDVACFYAVTEFVNGSFKIKKDGMGVIDVIQLSSPFSFNSGLSTLGKQLFVRPGINKEFLCLLENDCDLYELPHVDGFVFNQNESQSQQIFDQFHGGEDLMPQTDFLAKKLKTFRPNVVSQKAVKKNVDSNNHLGATQKSVTNALGANNIHVDRDFNPFFTRQELKPVYSNIKAFWDSFCSDLVFGPEWSDAWVELFRCLYNDPNYQKCFKL